MQTTTGDVRTVLPIREFITPVITIRTAEPDDAGALHRLLAEPQIVYNTVHLPSISLEQTRALLAEEDRHVLVACADDQVIGAIGLVVNSAPRLRHVAAICKLAVSGAWQGQGIGSRLLTAALDLADNWLNLVRIELFVYADNAPAIALYAKFGFVVEGTHRAAAFRAGQYADALSMARVRNRS
ncbi:MAG: GNAT family N-acetyltransferase [Chloroflexaceae bacterium]